ncbi:hypothetical protein PS726_00191 [Pseudomonas fluorescens]|uniref:hypothetical protein n=1 Tax=Pseudomonas fluorescens TaxID=294 RepID=UPI00123FE051|nr:hypothetical protein [Pseudomonas fluorescens]VVN67540.1 hypothetical protein PS726_00191 [Pseudomonas fluorescens]
MSRALLGGIALLVTVLALWRIEVADSARTLAEQASSNAGEKLKAEQQRTAEQAGVIADQRAQLKQAQAADRLFRSLAQAIAKDGDVMRHALQELKENDQAIADYLVAAVPAAYGVQFARPETTDPTQYKPGTDLPAGGLPSAGTPADTGQ